MRILNEMAIDFDLAAPKIIASSGAAVIENVKHVMLMDNMTITFDTGRCFISVEGRDLTISEIWEGRVEVEGTIEKIEFYRTLGSHSD